MAYICLVINVPNETITQLNADVQTVNTVSQELILLTNFIDGIKAGTKPTSVQVTTRDTDPGISTSGSGSQQNTYNHL